jgi:outer membrane protein OmpA-like peptidoglycan-associated protein
MRPIRYAALGALVAVGPVVAAAQGLKGQDTITRELTPTIGKPIDPTSRGMGPRPLPQPPTGQTASQAPPAETRPAASDLTVLFATGSAELTEEGTAQLNELARALTGNALASYRFRIEGYTDTVGGTDYNLHLSKKRAEAVVTYLVTTGHVAPDRLEAVGFGKTHLLVQTPDQTPEQRNRRVRVLNLNT